MPVPEWLFEITVTLGMAASLILMLLFVVAAGLFAVRQWKLLRTESGESVQRQLLEEVEDLNLQVRLLRERLVEDVEGRIRKSESRHPERPGGREADPD